MGIQCRNRAGSGLRYLLVGQHLDGHLQAASVEELEQEAEICGCLENEDAHIKWQVTILILRLMVVSV